jgi:hypothetical protein
VHDTPGSHVTRDYREGLGQLGDLRFRVVDTSGLEPAAPAASLQVCVCVCVCRVCRPRISVGPRVC